MMFGACHPHAAVYLGYVLHSEPAADGQAYGYLSWRAAHGIHVAQVHHHGLVSQAVEWHIGEVEVHTLHQQVGGDKCAHAFGWCQYGTVVSHALDAGLVFQLDVRGELADEAELTQFGYFHL